MATHSAIGFVEYDGSVRAIYCHSDGYPDNQMPLLTENYNTIEKVEELLDLGDLSSLGKGIGEQKDFNNPDYDLCLPYSARGEDVPAKDYVSIQHFKNNHSYSDYLYLFDGVEWSWEKVDHHTFRATEEA